MAYLIKVIPTCMFNSLAIKIDFGDAKLIIGMFGCCPRIDYALRIDSI